MLTEAYKSSKLVSSSKRLIGALSTNLGVSGAQ